MPRWSILLVFLASVQPSLAAQSPFAIRDVRVFDGRRVSEHRTVVVEGGVIRAVGGSALAVPPNALIVDGSGRTLLPGLIDAHVHLSEEIEGDLRQAASLGVTTVLDMWQTTSRFARIKAIEAADPPGMADVRTAGNGATAPGGHPSQMGGPPFVTVSDTTDPQAFVAARFAEGSDYLKIIYDDLPWRGRLPMLSRATLEALIAAAHDQGKLAVVHVGSEAQARDAVDAGADGLAHLFQSATPAPELVRLIARRHAFVVPTMTIYYNIFCGKPNGGALMADTLLRPYVRAQWRPMMTMQFGPPREPRSCAGTEAIVKDLVKHGVPVLTGTDSPSPGQTFGASVHGEMAFFVAAGLTPVQALTAATAAPAAAFRLTDRGAIRPGLRADLVLVDGDPTRRIDDTRRIVTVWKRGIPVDRVRHPE